MSALIQNRWQNLLVSPRVWKLLLLLWTQNHSPNPLGRAVLEHRVRNTHKHTHTHTRTHVHTNVAASNLGLCFEMEYLPLVVDG